MFKTLISFIRYCRDHENRNSLRLKVVTQEQTITRLHNQLRDKRRSLEEVERMFNIALEQARKNEALVEQYETVKRELLITIDNLNVDIQTLKRQNQILIDRNLQK